MENREIDFIARHYREGLFSASEGWRSMGMPAIPRLSVKRVVVAASIVIGISAAAALIIHLNTSEPEPETKPVKTEQTTTSVSAIKQSRAIDFDDASLPEVLDKIERVYGVRVCNLPDNAADTRLSLHYEGDVENLVDTINELLDTNLKIEEE